MTISLHIGKDKGRKNEEKNRKKLEVKHYAYPKKHNSESQLTWLSSPGCGSFWFLEIAKISISSLKGELCLHYFLRHYHIKSSQNYQSTGIITKLFMDLSVLYYIIHCGQGFFNQESTFFSLLFELMKHSCI